MFITLDGPSGVGKSTTVRALHDELILRSLTVRRTSEPSGGDIGRFIRNHFHHIRGHALACLVAADRYEHVAHEIQPWLAEGDTVVCDRYIASTLVMQRLDGVPLKFLLALTADAPRPDLAVILTADADLIAQRIADRGPANRFHRDPTAPAREVGLYSETAQALVAAGVRVLTVDTGAFTPGEIAERIADAVFGSSVASTASSPPTTSQGQ
ncbi:dTMP kinase [Streptomyces sp. BE147]|uniref:dTMP kinase n=1 Tax=Streptomyces sp. BE147 TaxID=3002524 RepID=UPI002E76EF0F|nr:dTMP kinase [Streptomyces sp. BE147]MEE1740190.1 dTMP kinase [Streptomyces sp. BE147]